MRFSTTRTAVLCAAAAAVFCGCEKLAGNADQKVKSQLSAAFAASAGGDEPSAESAFKQAADDTAASPEIRAVAKSSLARSQLLKAYKIAGEVDSLELQLSRLVSQATLLAQQARGGGVAIASYKQYDPKPISDAIAQKVQEAQGSADAKDWFKTDGVSIPTLTAAKQNVSKIQGDIAQLQEQQKNLEAERDKLLADAAAASEKSENSKGQESVDTYKTASDLRKQAGEKAIDLDKLAVQISRQQADLAIAQAEQTSVEEAVTQLQQDAQQREANWKQVDSDVSKRKEFATKLLGPEETGDTVAAFGKQINDLTKQIAEKRGAAEAATNDAIKYFQDANKDAEEAARAIRTELSDPKNAGRPTLDAFKALQEAVAPLNYKFQEGLAERALGTLYTAEAASLNQRIGLKDAVTLAANSVGAPVPASIGEGDLTAERQTKLNLADAAFKNSETSLGDVLDGSAGEDLKAAARIGRIMTYYSWSLLNKAAGDQKAADEHLAAAVTDRNAAATDNPSALPALPADLGTAPAPTTAPAANG